MAEKGINNMKISVDCNVKLIKIAKNRFQNAFVPAIKKLQVS
jgi:hypothetical protein